MCKSSANLLNNQKGLSLIEVLVASVILIMVVSVTAVIFTSVSSANWSTGRRAQALNYAQGLMEFMRTHNQDLLSQQGTWQDEEIADLGYLEPIPEGISPRIEIALYDEELDLAKVHVLVEWQMSGQALKTELVTLVRSK